HNLFRPQFRWSRDRDADVRGGRSSNRTSMRSSSRQAAVAVGTLFLLLTLGFVVAAQTSPRKLPSAEKIIDNYLKAIGGKKAVAGIRDATYDYSIQVNNQPFGTARFQTKLPASERW